MKKFICYIVLISFIITCIIPINVQASSKTLKDYKDELSALQNKQEENNRLSNATIAQITAKRNAITQANNDITENENKVEEAKEKVIQSKKDIEVKTEELNDLFNYTQSVDTEQVYLQFVIEANSIADLIERSAIIEQLVDYQEGELKRLEDLIKTNEELQVSLANENIALENSITEYEKKIDELNIFLSSVASVGLDYDQQIKAQKELIRIYETAGCKDSDYVDDCYYNKLINASSFVRPLVKGTVTQAYGQNGHYGIDIGGNASGTALYAAAPGVVASVSYKNKCGGNIVHIHHIVNGVAYTTEYAHMYDIFVKPGQTVTAATQIGTVGGGANTWYYDSCTSGVHLHYTVASGHYLGSGTNSYTRYTTFQQKSTPTGNAAITGIKNTRGYSFKTRY